MVPSTLDMQPSTLDKKIDSIQLVQSLACFEKQIIVFDGRHFEDETYLFRLTSTQTTALDVFISLRMSRDRLRRSDQSLRKVTQILCIWFKFYFFCFKQIIIHHHTPKQRKIKQTKDLKIEAQHVQSKLLAINTIYNV